MGMIINQKKRVRDLLIYREAIDRQWMVKKTVYGKESYAWGTLPPGIEQTFPQEMENAPRTMYPFRAAILAKQATRPLIAILPE